MASYFDAEAAIITRLKATVSEFKDVIGTAGIISDDPSTYCPLAQVSHEGFSALNNDRGEKTLIKQRWQIAIVVASPDDKDGALSRAEAGPLIIKVIQALAGWKPGAGYSAMALEQSRGDLYTSAGIAIYPMTFTTNVTI